MPFLWIQKVSRDRVLDTLGSWGEFNSSMSFGWIWSPIQTWHKLWHRRSNFLGTKFIIYDTLPPFNAGRLCSQERPPSRRFSSRKVSPKVPVGSYPMGQVNYELHPPWPPGAKADAMHYAFHPRVSCRGWRCCARATERAPSEVIRRVLGQHSKFLVQILHRR